MSILQSRIQRQKNIRYTIYRFLSRKIIALYFESYNILRVAKDRVYLQSIYIYIYKIEFVTFENINNNYIANTNSRYK